MYRLAKDKTIGCSGGVVLLLALLVMPASAAVDYYVTAPYTSPVRDTCGAGDDCGLRGTLEHEYRVTIPHAGQWSFNTCLHADLDTYIFVGTGLCTEDIGSNDDACGLQSEVVVNIPAGNYYCTVEGYTGCGEYIFDVHLAPPPNDDCADAIQIYDGLTGYDTTGATTDGPAHAECQYDGQIYNDVWYQYVATYTGELTVSTCQEYGGDAWYDTDLAVYECGDCADLVLLGCNDDALITCTASGTSAASHLVVPVVEGSCYLIRIGGSSSGDTGVGLMNVRCRSAAGRIFYVDGTCGNDGWSGLSPECQAPDGPKRTIQAAIIAAAPFLGDTIIVKPIVAPTGYNETLTIDKEDLTIISDGTGVPRIWSDTDDTPVVTISANGVTLGAPGQGFTIEQRDSGTGDPTSGCAAIMVDGDVVGPGTVTIEGNTIAGDDADAGLYVNAAIVGGHLVVRNNVFERYYLGVGTYSFVHAMHFESSDLGSPIGWACLNTATLDLLQNTVTDFDETGIYFDAYVFSSVVTIDDSSLAAVAVPSGYTYGIEFEDYVWSLSTVRIDNVTVQDVDEGVYIYALWANTTVDIVDCTFADIHAYGIDIDDEIGDGCDLLIDPCTITGDGSALAEYGIWIGDVYDGSTLTIADNTISGFAAGGMYMDYAASYLSAAWITGNTVQGGEISIEFDSAAYEGSATTVKENQLTDFAYAGVYVDDAVDYGSLLTVAGNTVTAHACGADYGFALDDYVDEGSGVEILENNISGFTDTGVYFYDDVEDGSWATVSNNTLTAASAGADYGIEFYYYIEYGSSATVTDNTIAGCDDGIWFDDYIEYGSSVTITGNTVTDFTDYGVYVYEAYEGSSCVIDDNALTGDGSASYGVYVDYYEYGSEGSINNNAISGILYEGIYVYELYDASDVTMNNNTITGDGVDSNYGVYVDYVESSTLNIDNNAISGFEYEGVYVYEAEYGSHLTIDNNLITDVGGILDEGIYVDYLYESTASMSGNTISGFDEEGIYLYEADDGSRLTINDNLITGAPGAYDGIYVDYVEYGSTGSINNNTISGFQYDGIYVYEAYEGAELTVDDNVVTGDGTTSEYGIYVDYVEDGSVGSISGNTVSGFIYDGIYFYELYDGSQLAIENNQITGLGGATPSDTGIYFDDYVDYGSVLSMNNNIIDGCYNGIYFDDYWEYGAEATVNRNTITGFTEYGIYVYEVYDGSDGAINENVLVGGLYPIYVDFLDYGSTVTINNNDVSGVEPGGYGIYCYNANDGSAADISGNLVRAGTGSAHSGIYVEYVYGGSQMTLWNNDVDFFEHSFYLEQYVEEGSTLLITGNHFAGGEYGMYFNGYFEYGCTCEIKYNDCTDFDTDGIHFDWSVHETNLLIEQNRFIGDATEIGIHFDEWIRDGSFVNVLGNCFEHVPIGVSVHEILDTAYVNINENDFDGVSTTGIRSINADVDHTIDGNDNWWGSAAGPGADGNPGVIGNVDTSTWLTATVDFDGDGVVICEDHCPNTPGGEDVDVNGCSCEQLDPRDDDGDGVDNCEDLCPGEDDLLDTDTDGMPDCLDGCPNDSGKVAPGQCGCGTPDTDSDGDGVANCHDLCPGEDDVDTDGDGVLDCFEECPEDPDKLEPGLCGCGLPDIDTDGDEIPDCFDPYPFNPDNQAEQAPPPVDTDGDGTPDESDGCPNDPDKTEPGVCGCGEDEVDTDGDEILDCMDNCPEIPNPGQIDIDQDGVGDSCDNCPANANADQLDLDADGTGDACDLAPYGVCGPGAAGLMPVMLLGLCGMKRRVRRR